MNNKIMLAVKSRTVWTVVAMFLVGGVSAVQSFIPVQYTGLVEGVLGLLAMYFHINPSQEYNTK